MPLQCRAMSWDAWKSLYGGLPLLVLVGLARVATASAELNKDGLPLPMSFENQASVLLLFSWWKTRTPAQYALCCLFCVLFGFISIALKVLRRFSEMRFILEEEQGKPMMILGSFPVYHNAIRGLVAFLNYSWDYMLMLVAMTFNVGIFLSMISGIALGFLFIGHLLDYVPEHQKENSGCGCGQDFSCGCQGGRPCTCCNTVALANVENANNVEDGEKVIAAQGVSVSASTCGKPQCTV